MEIHVPASTCLLQIKTFQNEKVIDYEQIIEFNNVNKQQLDIICMLEKISYVKSEI